MFITIHLKDYARHLEVHSPMTSLICNYGYMFLMLIDEVREINEYPAILNVTLSTAVKDPGVPAHLQYVHAICNAEKSTGIYEMKNSGKR